MNVGLAIRGELGTDQYGPTDLANFGILSENITAFRHGPAALPILNGHADVIAISLHPAQELDNSGNNNQNDGGFVGRDFDKRYGGGDGMADIPAAVVVGEMAAFFIGAGAGLAYYTASHNAQQPNSELMNVDTYGGGIEGMLAFTAIAAIILKFRRSRNQ